jgi:hypothetical protein
MDDEKPHYGKGSGFHGKGRAEGGRSGVYSRGNAKALRHGMRGSKLPKGCEWIEVRVNDLRRQVEAEVIAVKGEVNLVDAAAINSILKWERFGLLAGHWLRKEADKMSCSDRLRFAEAVARASDYRDRNIKALGLTVRPADPWMVPLLPGPNGSTPATPTAPDGQSEESRIADGEPA